MVERLDRFDEPTGEWQELVVEDRHSTPADVAATRVDFRAWLESLPERTRRVAETLATGEATSHVARMFGCSASRISQLRRELYNAWRVFTGEAAPGDIISFGLILDRPESSGLVSRCLRRRHRTTA